MSFAFIVMGVLGFFGGRLNDRYGPRLVLAVTGTLFGLGYALLHQVTQPWQLFAWPGQRICPDCEQSGTWRDGECWLPGEHRNDP